MIFKVRWIHGKEWQVENVLLCKTFLFLMRRKPIMWICNQRAYNILIFLRKLNKDQTMLGFLDRLSSNHMTPESSLSTWSDIHTSQRTLRNLLAIMLPWRSENHILVERCNFYLCVADILLNQIFSWLICNVTNYYFLKTILYYFVYMCVCIYHIIDMIYW